MKSIRIAIGSFSNDKHFIFLYTFSNIKYISLFLVSIDLKVIMLDLLGSPQKLITSQYCNWFTSIHNRFYVMKFILSNWIIWNQGNLVCKMWRSFIVCIFLCTFTLCTMKLYCTILYIHGCIYPLNQNYYLWFAEAKTNCSSIFCFFCVQIFHRIKY